MSPRKLGHGRFNTQMAPEANQNQQTINQNAREYAVNPSSKGIGSDRLSEYIKRVDSGRDRIPKAIKMP